QSGSISGARAAMPGVLPALAPFTRVGARFAPFARVGGRADRAARRLLLVLGHIGGSGGSSARRGRRGGPAEHGDRLALRSGEQLRAAGDLVVGFDAREAAARLVGPTVGPAPAAQLGGARRLLGRLVDQRH